MKIINYGSIRSSLVFLVLLIFLPFSAIVIHSALVYKQSAKEVATENALRVARNLADQQKLVETNTRQFLEVLSQLPEIKSGDTSKINPLLKTLLRQNQSYASLLMVDKHGDMLATGSKYAKINVSDRNYFHDVMRTRSFAAGEYTRGRLTYKPVIHYAFPVTDSNNEIAFVLITSFDLNYYNQNFSKSNLGKDAVFKFMDRNGTILYQSPNQHDDTVTFDQLASQQKESTFVVKGTDNVKRLFAVENLSLNDEQPYIYISVGVPEKIAFAEFRKIFTLNMSIWLIGVLIVIITAYLFSKKFIIEPIDHLVDTTHRIADGRLDVRTGIKKSNTELGMLAFAIDDMTEKLLQRDQEQKRVQKDLRRLKERFELAINAAHIGILDWHIQNNILIWDANMFELYGVNQQDFGYKYESWRDLVVRQDWVYLDAEIQNAIEYHRPLRSEFRINHPTKGIKHIRIFANVIDDKSNKPVRLIGVNWDMTERKTLERKLSEAKHKAETNDKLKSTFLANVSHEIRTPLHGIIGFAQILKEQGISNQERSQYLDIIISSGNKLMTIISNIIDISMLDANQLSILETECNLQKLLQEIYESYDIVRKRENKNFSFSIEYEIDQPFVLNVDEYRFKQIFSNLIDNAFKFTEKGEVKIGCRFFEGELLCYVKDSGIGISSENLIKVFDRFKQVEENNNRSYSGNGLGLSICKGLLDLMGGRIWAISKENGSDFYFSFPLADLQNSRSQRKSSSENSYLN